MAKAEEVGDVASDDRDRKTEMISMNMDQSGQRHLLSDEIKLVDSLVLIHDDELALDDVSHEVNQVLNNGLMIRGCRLVGRS